MGINKRILRNLIIKRGLRNKNLWKKYEELVTWALTREKNEEKIWRKVGGSW